MNQSIDRHIEIFQKLVYSGSKYIAEIYGVYTWEETSLFFIEDVEGCSLTEYVCKNLGIVGIKRLAEVFADVLQGIYFLRSNLIPLENIKVENIIILDSGEVKIKNFLPFFRAEYKKQIEPSIYFESLKIPQNWPEEVKVKLWDKEEEKLNSNDFVSRILEEMVTKCFGTPLRKGGDISSGNGGGNSVDVFDGKNLSNALPCESYRDIAEKEISAFFSRISKD